MKALIFALAAAVSVGVSVKLSEAADNNLKNLDFDLSQLKRENFYDVLIPLAKKEGSVTMYNYAGNFSAVWKELIARYEAKYDIKVKYSDVDGDQADQQLIAVHQAQQDSPADVYFNNGGSYGLLSSKGVVGNLPLTKILPNMDKYDPALGDMVEGQNHGGSYPLVHMNQTAIGYNSEFVKPGELPKNFDELLSWAEAHPKRLGVTLPTKGGSGSGFIYSVALNYLNEDCRKQLTNYSLTRDEAEEWAMTSECLEPVWDYYKRLLAVSELTNGNADTLNLINNQQLYIGTVWEDQVTTFLKNKQLPDSIRVTLLESGEVGTGDSMFVPADAKNVAAAMLLIDMAMSKEFQTWKLENKVSRSPRTDVTGDLIPESARQHVLPADVYPRLRKPAFTVMALALGEALNEKVLNQ